MLKGSDLQCCTVPYCIVFTRRQHMTRIVGTSRVWRRRLVHPPSLLYYEESVRRYHHLISNESTSSASREEDDTDMQGRHAGQTCSADASWTTSRPLLQSPGKGRCGAGWARRTGRPRPRNRGRRKGNNKTCYMKDGVVGTIPSLAIVRRGSRPASLCAASPHRQRLLGATRTTITTFRLYRRLELASGYCRSLL